MKSMIFTLALSVGLFAATNHTAKITETLSSGGYTYMKVQEDKNLYWIAMTQRDVKVGQNITYGEQGWMKNFQSKTLNRTFDNILFASDVTTGRTKLADVKPNIMTSQYKEASNILKFSSPKISPISSSSAGPPKKEKSIAISFCSQ